MRSIRKSMLHRIEEVRRMENKEMQAAPKKGVIRRIIRTLFSFYPVLMPVVLFCILFNAIVSDPYIYRYTCFFKVCSKRRIHNPE